MSKTVTIEIEVGSQMLDQLNSVLAILNVTRSSLPTYAIEQLQQLVEHNLNCDGTCVYADCTQSKIAKAGN